MSDQPLMSNVLPLTLVGQYRQLLSDLIAASSAILFNPLYLTGQGLNNKYVMINSEDNPRTRQSRRRPKKKKIVPPPLTTRHQGRTSPYDILPAGESKRLIDAAIELLATSGVVFEPGSEALDLLASHGCQVSADGIVLIPAEMVRAALSSVARTVQLWNRDATDFITLGKDDTLFIPGMTCINVFDLESREVRPSTRADLETITRVADALAHIDAVTIACKNVERSDIFGEIDEFSAMAANTTKPLEYLCEYSESLEVVIELAAVIRGSREALREKPYFAQIVTPLPLNFARSHSDQIIAAVRAGVPVVSGTLPIGGASSPITIAGCLVQSLATDFAAIVLGQLVESGSFCIGGSDVSFMEPATGGIGSFVQASLADMAIIQVMRELDLPSFTGIAGCSVARRFNQDAVWEITATMMQTFYSRPATCDYLGTLDGGMTFSLQTLLLCDDLAGMLRHMWRGVETDDDQVALELAREIGPLGNYLANQHTVDHCRAQVWTTRYFGPNIPLNGDDRPDLDLYDRIDLDLHRIVAEHQPEPLTVAVAEQMQAIQQRFEDNYEVPV